MGKTGIALIGLFLGLSGCFSARFSSEKPPDWTRRLPERPLSYQGVGHSLISQEDADQKALVSLASSISVTVESEVRESVNNIWLGRTVEEKGLFTQLSSALVNQEIEGVLVKERWPNPKKKEHWAYAEVEVSNIQERLRKRTQSFAKLGDPRFIVLPDPDNPPGDLCAQGVYHGIVERLASYKLQVVDPRSTKGILVRLERMGISIPQDASGKDYSLGMAADFAVYYGCRSWFPPAGEGDRFIYSTTHAEVNLHDSSMNRLVSSRDTIATEHDFQDSLTACTLSARKAGQLSMEGLYSASVKEWLQSASAPKLYRIIAHGVDSEPLRLIENILEQVTNYDPQLRSYQSRTAILEVWSEDSTRSLVDNISTGLHEGKFQFDMESEGRMVFIKVHQ